MVSSINTNTAALYAQANIATATAQSASSVARLSSGNRIVEASDDVTALAIGTSLGTQVSALKTAQTNASQGSSLLQVADGALAQIQSILQQQESIAQQAQSGSLTDTDRGFLNQEFQSLSSEINSLAGSTSFNGVNLLDGSISGQTGVTTNTLNGTSTAVSSAAAILTVATSPSSGATVTIDGVQVTFTSSAPGTSGAVGKVSIGSTADDTAQNLATFLNAAGDPQFANLEFFDAGSGALEAHWTGGVMAGSVNITSSTSDTTNITGTGTTTIGTTAASQDGLSIDRTSAIGTISGTILANGGTSDYNAGDAIDTSGVYNNADFTGSLGTGNVGEITGTYDSGLTDGAVLSLQVGGITYTTAATSLTQSSPSTPIALTFTGKDSGGNAAGGSFTINLSGSGITHSSITGQSELNGAVAQINNALSGVSFYQNRDVTSFQTGGDVTVGGVQVANLNGLSANFNTNDFTANNISSITVTAPTTGTTDAQIQMVINGQTYTTVAGIGSQIATNTVIALQDESDPTKTFTLVTGLTGIAGASGTALDLSSQANASAVQTALETALGLNNAGASLTFQLGSTSASNVGVSIGSATTNSLFGGATLDVSNQTDASAAATAVNNALNTVTALRSGVGALESQFNFASAALQTSVQNEGAAQSDLLDTDISSESTNFATEQVKLQAGISVLAQANQQLQALLKLIG